MSSDEFANRSQEVLRKAQEAEKEVQQALGRIAAEGHQQNEVVRHWADKIAASNQERHEATLAVAELAKANMASQFYKRLLFWIEDFDRSLDSEHEVGVRLVSFGQTIMFRVEELGYNDPSLIVFHGRMDDGNPVTLVQHINQISFLLTSLQRKNPTEPKVPFGFMPQRVRDFHDKAVGEGMQWSDETGRWTDKEGKQFDREGNLMGEDASADA
jgi:hypothetical protein